MLQVNHYYPFGLQMEGVAVNTALPTDPNRKLYNAGSDWQKETAGAALGILQYTVSGV
ncbi:MAG: hypothetical protein WBG62_19305 [Cyclobacteriaceae bacterium]